MDKKIHEGFREEGTLELKLEGGGNRPLVSKAQCTIHWGAGRKQNFYLQCVSVYVFDYTH